MENTGSPVWFRALRLFAGAVLVLTVPAVAQADRFGTKIPMYGKGAATYYVSSYVSGLGATEMMVDTGSGYVTINEEALATLSAQGKAHYVKKLRGMLANGTEMVVPVYRLDSLRIGEECWLHDVHAAVFPGRTRFILGLSALSKASPFSFEFEPPQLALSNCGKSDLTKDLTKAAEAAPVVPQAAVEQPRLASAAEH